MKKIFYIIFIILIVTGCSNKTEKFYLSKKYYNSNSFIKINTKDINKLKNENYLIFTYNDFCSLKIPCDKVFQKFMDENNISMYSISFKELKKKFFYKKVEYGPSIIIIKKGKIIDYLDAESNEHLKYYQDSKELKKWLDKYIYLKNKTN